MDRMIWKLLCAAVRSADRRTPRVGRRPIYTDQQIVKMYLWAVWHDRPLCWACDRDHYTIRPHQALNGISPTAYAKQQKQGNTLLLNGNN